MYFSIKYKILLTIFISTVAVVGGMWLLVSRSFDRGFVGYISSVEQDVQKHLARALADEYRRDGGWDKLKSNPRRWHELHMESLVKSGPAPFTRAFRVAPPDVVIPAPGPPVAGSVALPFPGPPDAGVDELPFNVPVPGPPVGAIERMPGPHAGMRFLAHGPVPRTILFDADKNVVLGQVGERGKVDYSPIIVDGQTVGYLGVRPPAQPFEHHEVQFSRRQAHAFMTIAVIMMALSALIALPMTRRLVKPIGELSSATRRLASGRYDTRISVSSNDELGKLSRDFNTLARTLEDNERSRRQWIADISHELRTPLSVLQGEIEAMQDGVRESTPERLQSLHQQTASLARLVNDLYELSMSDIGALSYQKQRVNLAELLQSCIESWREPFAGRRIELRVHLPSGTKPAVFGDPNRLRQLIINLFENSLHYTDPGGVVELRLSVEGGSAVIDVQDSAPGVAEQHQPRLFDRLYRVETSRSRATGGTGLGLAICKSIVDAHEGQITAQTSALGGLWVRVTLPVES